jgi:hemolysin D
MSIIKVDKVVTAQGKVVARAPTIVVQPLETAIVRSIEVHEGETVHAGQILARLDPTFAAADLEALKSQVAAYSARRADAGGNGWKAVQLHRVRPASGAGSGDLRAAHVGV